MDSGLLAACNTRSDSPSEELGLRIDKYVPCDRNRGGRNQL